VQQANDVIDKNVYRNTTHVHTCPRFIWQLCDGRYITSEGCWFSQILHKTFLFSK